MDEHKLIQQAQNGDKGAFQGLIEWYYPYVTKFLVGLLGDPKETEDLAQDTFLKMIRGIERFDPYGSASFSTWLMTIAKRTYIDYLRKNRHAALNIDELEIAIDQSMEDAIISKSMAADIMAAIESLPPEQAAAIRLRHLEQLSLKEIAAQMHCQPQTVKSRIHNGIVKIRNSLRGGTVHG